MHKLQSANVIAFIRCTLQADIGKTRGTTSGTVQWLASRRVKWKWVRHDLFPRPPNTHPHMRNVSFHSRIAASVYRLDQILRVSSVCAWPCLNFLYGHGYVGCC